MNDSNADPGLIVCVGNEDDAFVAALAGSTNGAAPTVFIDERDAFARTPFALRIRGSTAEIRLQLDGHGRINASDLAGVVLRPTRGVTWHPRARVEDRHFLHHESMAAWFALLGALPCPVANRFPLEGWWCDETVHARLGADLASVLAEIPVVTRGKSAYLASATVREASPDAAPLVSFLLHHGEAVRAWQESTGTFVCRVEVTPGGETLVDPAPDFAGVDPKILALVAAGTIQGFV